MFIYDKDIERVILAKKKEVLCEIEAAKARVLKELYCIKRGVHTDMCEMLADYNRIDFTLKKTVKDCKAQLEATVKEFQTIIANTFNEYNAEIDLRIKHLENLESQVIAELNAKIAEFENMEARVSDAIAQLENLIAEGVVSQDDFDAFKEEVNTLLESAGTQSDWNETDETSKAFILNKTHGVTAAAVHVQVSTDYDMNGSYRIPFHIGADVRPVSVEAIIDGKNVSIPYTGKVNCLVYELENGFWLKRGGTFDIYGDVYYEGGTLWASTVAAYIVGEYLYITINVNYNSNTLRAAMEGTASLDMTAYANESVQLLDAKFLANNPSPNSFLRYVGGSCEWTNELFKPVETVEIITVYDGMAAFVEEDDTHIYFTLGDCGNAPFESQFIPHSVRVGTLQMGFSSSSATKYGTSATAVFYTEADGTLTCKFNKDNIAHLGDYQNEGAYILIQRQGEITHETLVELFSPNGTKYKLTVSDDGTLSATAMTE